MLRLLLLVSAILITETKSEGFLVVHTKMIAGFGDNVRRYYEYFELANMLERTLVLSPFSVNAADGTAMCKRLNPIKLHKKVKI